MPQAAPGGGLPPLGVPRAVSCQVVHTGLGPVPGTSPRSPENRVKFGTGTSVPVPSSILFSGLRIGTSGLVLVLNLVLVFYPIFGTELGLGLVPVLKPIIGTRSVLRDLSQSQSQKSRSRSQ